MKDYINKMMPMRVAKVYRSSIWLSNEKVLLN